ncbi:putative enoyl-CoA hydratase 1 [compost metagenome]
MTIPFTESTPGQRIAEFTSSIITPQILQAYAEASGDSNPLHLDKSFAQKAGFDDVIVHGMLGMALLGRLLTAHFAPQDIRSFSARFVSTIPVGKQIHCYAELAERSPHGLLLNLFAQPLGSEKTAIRGQARIAALALQKE